VQKGECWKFSPAQITQLCSIWGMACAADGTLTSAQLNKLVRSLPPPLSIGEQATQTEAAQYISNIGVVQVTPGRYTFEHTAFALVASLAEVPLPASTVTDCMKQDVADFFLKVCCCSSCGDHPMSHARNVHCIISNLWTLRIWLSAV
jgi:hypothetical protein